MAIWFGIASPWKQWFWEDKTYTIRSSVGQGAWNGVTLGAWCMRVVQFSPFGIYFNQMVEMVHWLWISCGNSFIMCRLRLVKRNLNDKAIWVSVIRMDGLVCQLLYAVINFVVFVCKKVATLTLLRMHRYKHMRHDGGTLGYYQWWRSGLRTYPVPAHASTSSSSLQRASSISI